jgi:glycosidase
MQWNRQSFSGFSTSTPWLPVNPDYITRNVQTQQSDPASLLNWYRQLIKLRRDLPSLQSGIFQPVTYEPRQLLAYLRQTDDQSVLVILNFGHRPTQLFLGGALLRTGWSLLASSKLNRTEIKIRSGKLSVNGQEALLLFNQA